MEANEFMEDSDKIHEHGSSHAEQEDNFRKWVGIYIGLLAMLLAVGVLAGNSASKKIFNDNIVISDTYNYYQAKTLRQFTLHLAAEEAEALRQLNDGGNVAGLTALEHLAADDRKAIAAMEDEPDKGDGKKQLLAKAKALEAERDDQRTREPFYELGEALLQIAIVLGSVTIVTRSRTVMAASVVLAGLALLMLINGYALFLPFKLD